MVLEESVDCDVSCSNFYPIGCRLINHEECEDIFEDSIKKLPSNKYSRFSTYMRDNHPAAYKILRFFGL